MKYVRPIVVILSILALLRAATPAAWGATTEGKSGPAAARLGAVAATKPVTRQAQEALKVFDLSPAIFVENKGQWDNSIRYGFDGKGTRVSFTDEGPVFQMLKSEGEDGKVSQAVFSAKFVGGNTVVPTALEPSSAKMSFYHGNDPSNWQSDVPTYKEVAYKGLYDGVDLYTWGKRSGLKYEFHVAPGASWERIVIKYNGIDCLSIDEKGALHVKTSLGEIVDGAPVVYQETADGTERIASRFRLIDDHSYGFDVMGAYDKSLPLVLDPDLVWGSYLGGSQGEEAFEIAIDSTGNVWLTGYTMSSDFPTPGGFQPSVGGGDGDAFVAEISPSGTLAWASYLGGNDIDYGNGIAIDSTGNAWIAGETYSSDFPTPGGFQTGYGGSSYMYGDAFVARITPSGKLAWASYLGGSADDEGKSIAIDSTGNAWVTGYTLSSDFPTPGGFQTSADGVFVARITPSGTLDWASHLGGGGGVGQGNGIAIDSTGNAWVTGCTTSPDFPTPGGFQTSYDGNWDAFVAMITPSGTLGWASYLGGNGTDYGVGVAIDSTGNVWVTGDTSSSDFQTPGGFQTNSNGGGVPNLEGDAFVARITPSGTLGWASYLGGSGGDGGYGIAIDSLGNAWVIGCTTSSDFPTPGASQTGYGGNWDAFVARITPSGTLAEASYLGGSGDDGGYAIALDVSGGAWVTGYTSSSDFPVPGGFRTSETGGDVFVAQVKRDALAVTTGSLPVGTAGWAYPPQSLHAGGGTRPYTWSTQSGMPAGLSLVSSTGVISGTPSASGTLSFTAQVTDNVGATAAQALSIAVNAAPLITTGILPAGAIDAAYSQTLTSTGGTTPLAWSILSDSLPPGLSIGSPTGVISGTPTATGIYNFTAMVTDNVGATATAALPIAINAYAFSITTSSLPAGPVNTAYSQTLAASGGTMPYTWTIASGSLPSGLSFVAESAAITGTPTATGTSSFTVTVADTLGAMDARALSIAITPPLAITTARLHHAALKTAYNEPLYALGGTSPYDWSAVLGTLPQGLSLGSFDSTTGVLSGTPTTSGKSLVVAQVCDACPWTATKALSLTVTPAPAEWLTIDKFSLGLPANPGHDSFVLQGSYNTWPDVYAPETVVLTIGNWHIAANASSWTRVGKSNVYTWSKGGVTGQITYWVNGTSRCQFKFTGSNMTLRRKLKSIPNVPVTLAVGIDMNETVVAKGMTVKNQAATMTSYGSPVLCIQKLAVIRNLTKVGHDSVTITGLLCLDSDFNPARDALTMNIDGQMISLPAKTMRPAKNGVVSYTKPTPYGKLILSLNNRTHVLTVNATGVDMSSVARPAEVSLTITNHPGAVWDYALFMAKSKAGTAYTY